MNNIYFIGMPGCGKSTLAKLAAEKLGREYIDSDLYIEEKMQMKIPEIFEKYGENFFRERESEALFEISEKNGVFAATGGGIVKCEKNTDVMKKSGKIVYIKILPENILKNSALEGRPLLKDKSALFKLYGERRELYAAAADIVIENDGNVADALRKIVDCGF